MDFTLRLYLGGSFNKTESKIIYFTCGSELFAGEYGNCTAFIVSIGTVNFDFSQSNFFCALVSDFDVSRTLSLLCFPCSQAFAQLYLLSFILCAPSIYLNRCSVCTHTLGSSKLSVIVIAVQGNMVKWMMIGANLKLCIQLKSCCLQWPSFTHYQIPLFHTLIRTRPLSNSFCRPLMVKMICFLQCVHPWGQ